VSGVATLFSREFYARVGRHLAPDGLFVQWLQLYEFNDSLMLSVLGALTREFADYVVYSTDDHNILIVARRSGSLGTPDLPGLFAGSLAPDLARVGLRSPTDLVARRSADKRMIDAVLAARRVPQNSDFFPYLDLNAGAARFRRDFAGLMREWTVSPLPVLEMLTGDALDTDRITPDTSSLRLGQVAIVVNLYEERVAGRAARYAGAKSPSLAATFDTLGVLAQTCASGRHAELWRSNMQEAAEQALPYLDPARAEALVHWASPERCAAGAPERDAAAGRLYLAVARRDAAGMAAAGGALLDTTPPTDARLRGYALGAAMLGELGRGDAQAAADLWQRFGRPLAAAGPLPAHLELLADLAGAPRATAAPAR
jgi:spermidine synthase